MAEKIFDRATLLAIIGLILFVWTQLSNGIKENAQAISRVEVETLKAIAESREESIQAITESREGNIQAIADVQKAIADVQKAIADVRKDVAVLNTTVFPLVPKIDASIRNTHSNREEIRELKRRVTTLEGDEP